LAKEVPLDADYTYESSGLDGFMTRQQDVVGLSEVTSSGDSGELNFDNLQTSGSLGSIVQIGSRLRLNGIDGRIEQLNEAGEITGIVGNLDV
jgi:hypothetical protein